MRFPPAASRPAESHDPRRTFPIVGGISMGPGPSICVLLCFLALPGAGAAQTSGFEPLDPEGGSLDPSAVGSPDALVATLYDVISGPADAQRDWDRFRSLFVPGARLTIARWQTPDGVVEEVRAADVEGFIEAAGQSYRRAGFWEREIWSRTERFGNVAHVFSTYESRVGSEESEPVQRGINSFQLVRTDGRWWVTSIAWDVEVPGNPIPQTYLPD